MGRIRNWSDVRRVGAHNPAQLLFFAVVAAGVALLAVVGHCVLSHSASQPTRSVVQLVSTQTSGVVCHAQQVLNGKSMCKAAKPLATALLPRSPAAALMLLGTVLAGLLVSEWLAKLVVPAGRGPPGAPVVGLSGQALLTRFCLARR